MKIAIVSGSTRTGRTSHRVALALEHYFITKGAEVTIVDLMQLNLPQFSERFSALPNKPIELEQTSKLLQRSNAIVFLSPEYNGSITSALKNMIDVFGKTEFAAKPIGVATASSGIMGGVRAAYQLQQIILALQAYPQPQMLLVADVANQLNERGEITNPIFEKKLAIFGDSFLTFARRFL
jgi:NAD(P)H-dependent FMN reductase